MRNEPEELNRYSSSETGNWKFNFTIGFSIVSMGLSLVLWGGANYCNKVPNCDLQSIYLFSANTGFYFMLAGFALMILGPIFFFLLNKYGRVFSRKNNASTWKKVLSTLYLNITNGSYFSGGNVGFLSKEHPLAKESKISGGDLTSSLCFLNNSGMIKGYLEPNQMSFIELTDKGLKVALENEKMKRTIGLQLIIAYFAAISAWIAISNMLTSILHLSALGSLFTLVVGFILVIPIVFQIIEHVDF